MVVLADDLTGALESGAKFAVTGIESLVTTELSRSPRGTESGVPVLVVDTDSRHLSPSEAGRRIRILVSLAHRRAVEHLYKKTDSTLRGNIGAELEAMSEACADLPVVYAPSYPAMGRTVEGGVLFVDGRPVNETEFATDALNPVAESHIPTILARQCRLPVFSPPRLESGDKIPSGIHVYDGRTDGDLAACARFLLENPGRLLAAGPAALLYFIAESLDWPRKGLALAPSAGGCLIVCGSRSPTSLRQIEHALANGFRAITATGLEHERLGPGWLILSPNDEGAAAPRAVSRRTGEIVRQIIVQSPPDLVLAIGGDTARGIVQALGSPVLFPLGEILPGVPLSRLEDPMRKGEWIYLITKAGGFGPVDIMTEIRRKLERKD